MHTDFTALTAELSRISNHKRIGRVAAVGTASLEIAGLTHQARIGDQVSIALAGAGLTLLAASPTVSMAPWSRLSASLDWAVRVLRGR